MGDWVANGVLFALYLHVPWVIPQAPLDTFIVAYPSKRYRSALIGIIVHSSQSVVFTALARRRRAQVSAGLGSELDGRCPGQGKTWQDCVAAVGSFGFRMTTSLWPPIRVSDPRTPEAV